MNTPIIEIALRAFNTYLGELKKEKLDISDTSLTGRWVVHSGFFGSSDADPTYLFEVNKGDSKVGWIDELGLYVADDVQDYFKDAA